MAGQAIASIDLPLLQIEPIKESIGKIFHVIKKGSVKNVSRTQEIQISPRILEKVYTLADGQRIIITERSNLIRPVDVDGILKLDSQGKYKWISHKLTDQLAIEINTNGITALSINIENSWKDQFKFNGEIRSPVGDITQSGLRPPQIGALHAIASHWSIYDSPATLIMPTGTGKTETMLAAMIALRPGPILVIIPSLALKRQTFKKFLTLGLLRKLGVIPRDLRNPVVGIVDSRPRSDADLEIFGKCNVVICIMQILGVESVLGFARLIAPKIRTLIVDEAHHIAAPGWSEFRESFSKKQVLQFTATPFRRDGKLVDGKIIYEYPLHIAQREGYFKKINFISVYEIDNAEGDRVIAEKAIEILNADLSSGKDHLLMARCANISRAQDILQIYQEISPEYMPVLIHSEEDDAEQNIQGLIERRNKIVVCVNMLGEGFDLPQLKIAAVHDPHKSLAILLQFTGRFTRTSDDRIGDATVIANIANVEVSNALERLYSEDADWNLLLEEFSSEAAQAHAQLIEFLNESNRVDLGDETDKIEISKSLLHPSLNTLFYRADQFNPLLFNQGLPKGVNIHRIWHNTRTKTLYFVARYDIPLKWSRSKDIKDREWHLFVLHFKEEQGLLFLSSTDKDSTHFSIATAVGATGMISGENIFRSLGKINRLTFQQVGVKKHGRRNLGYAMYTGSDVGQALSMAERVGSSKSNFNGTGWEDGSPVTIGCSGKGRVWARDTATVPELIAWCEHVGNKILDESIDTRHILENVLVPEEVTSLPDLMILGIEWPIEILRQSEERVNISTERAELSIAMFELQLLNQNIEHSYIDFSLKDDTERVWGAFRLTIGGEFGFGVTLLTTSDISIKIGKLNTKLVEYFSSYPPLIRFIDMSELDGNLYVKPRSPLELTFPSDNMEVWDWDGVNIRLESIWKNNRQRTDSIQRKVAEIYMEYGYELVFDDDAPGEAADLVCLRELELEINLVLIHCKFSGGDESGERIKDVVEVCSQAIRSSKWKWKFKDLCSHLIRREKRLSSSTRSRFLEGSQHMLQRFSKLSRFKEVKAEIIIVQPGLSKEGVTEDQIGVLAACHSFLKETIDVDLHVICSQ